MTTEKLSTRFREKIESLGKGQTMCVVVSLKPPALVAGRRMGGRERQVRVETVQGRMKETVGALKRMVELEGGDVLSVSNPLSMVTIRARRSLIERLSDVESVKAIMENQPVSGIGQSSAGYI